jgi:hypothetical protein
MREVCHVPLCAAPPISQVTSPVRRRSLNRWCGSGNPISAIATRTGDELRDRGGVRHRARLEIAGEIEDGILLALHRATSPQAGRGAFYGPRGFYQLAGEADATSEADARRLWEVSEELRGVSYPASD